MQEAHKICLRLYARQSISVEPEYTYECVGKAQATARPSFQNRSENDDDKHAETGMTFRLQTTVSARLVRKEQRLSPDCLGTL